MKFANSVSLRVFCKGSEDRDLVLGIFKGVLGFDDDFLLREKISIGCVEASGFEDKILIFEVVLLKDRHINSFLGHLNGKLSSFDRSLLVSQVNRFDDEFNFFLRLSKSALFGGSFELTDSGDCVHVKINVACFPKNLDSARVVVGKIFS